jgi:rubredoxin
MEAEQYSGSSSVGEGEKGSMGSTAMGMGTAPLSGTVTSAGIAQKGTPVAERMAYVCNDCGYIYDQETPFEEVDPETYKCPVCSAPKSRYTMQNLTVGEAKESNEAVSS